MAKKTIRARPVRVSRPSGEVQRPTTASAPELEPLAISSAVPSKSRVSSMASARARSSGSEPHEAEVFGPSAR